MPLHLVSSNQVEALQQHLTELLRAQPLQDPFTPELIIVPNMAMARWLNLQLARTQGIAANIKYPLAASWIWDQTVADLPNVPGQDPLSRELAAWKIFAALPALLSVAEFEPLRRYLVDDQNGVKRWQLSERIADVFDRYQFYRPDWIRAWSDGQTGIDQPWQPILWRHLVANLEDNHRVALLDRLQQKLHKGARPQHLPQRIICFALSSLPPLYIEVFQALAAHTDLYLFQHSPTEHYWADLKSKKQQSRMRVNNADQADYYDTANDLLASWGRQGQAFQDLLLGDDSLETAQWESYKDPGSDTLLHRLQQDIYKLQESSICTPADDSILFAVCHSAMRECQVLHDELLRTLERYSDLQPEDILVMVPQISEYAPYIEAVFSRNDSDSRPFIPWNLSDITLADEHPLIGIFLQLLALPKSRFTISEVKSYLEVPEIAARFGLDQQSCDTMAGLLEDSVVYWGIDGAHKQSLNLPAIAENTWEFALQRLLASYAFGERVAGQDYWHGIALVAGVEGGSAQSVGNFCLFLERLCEWRTRLRDVRNAGSWQQTLNEMLDDLFVEWGDEDDKLQLIREAIDELCQLAGAQTLSLDLLTIRLQEALGQQTVRGRFFSGGVTFCGMRPMRSLPFQVICLLGMNDQAFPRREQPIEFDLMSRHWHPGDPRKGDEDRYLLLETLLCARQKLYISYTGRSLKDNSICQPSVLVRQLLDFIDAQYHPLSDPTSLMSEHLSRIHSMQPFSPRNYQNGAAGPGYDRYWCHVAQILNQDKVQSADLLWPQDKIAALRLQSSAQTGAEDETVNVDLSRLRRFLAHPVAYFFKYRLHIFLQEQPSNEDEETFALDDLQVWQLKDRLAGDWIAGLSTSHEALRAEGLLPHGIFAAAAFNKVQEQSEGLLDQLADYQNISSEPRHIALRLAEGQTLNGQVSYLPGKGLLHYSPSSLKGKALLGLWVEHLALCAAGVLQEDEFSVLISRDESIRFRPFEAVAAMRQLQIYVNLYQQGMQRPLPIFPESTYAFAKASDDEAGLKAAFSKWNDSSFLIVRGEECDPYVQLALRGCTGAPLNDIEFRDLSKQLYSVALDLKEEVV